MRPLLIGLLLGIGLFCIWWSFWPVEPTRERSTRAGLRARLGDDLAQAGYVSVTPGNVLLACGIGLVLVFALVAASTRVVPVALCFAVMAGYAPLGLVRSRARKRRAQMRDLWPDAVDNIGSAVRAGLALPEALSQLSVRGPEELRPAFAAFAENYRTSGRFQDCLDRLKERLSDPVGDRLIESLGSPGRSAAPTSAGCCAPCPCSFVRTPAPGPSWRPDRGGPSTRHASRPRRRG